MVVVAGATGSGKTTHFPKICLKLGRGIRGTIGHTQPRRLAARTVAQRITDELGTLEDVEIANQEEESLEPAEEASGEGEATEE